MNQLVLAINLALIIVLY